MLLYDQAVATVLNARPGVREFFISVCYCQRTYRYKVEQLPLGEGEELIRVISPKKTVQLTARRLRTGRDQVKKKYSYDKTAFSNKLFMGRIIEAIEQYPG
ncbi:hypothetical protein V9K67_21245 [Paraflavisolibacter sp. H34]|uniref:hypothetical protein n=1 Tax=Huijunlia imazamoxiresistens TaxID=3127457 RepID=UPI00301A7E21